MIKKIIQNNNFLFIFILSGLTFITRIINLLNIPIFTDEAIYIRWAQIGLADRAQWFISLTDGKQPLLTWLMYPTLLFFKDPLVAGRLVSVLSGSVSVVALYLIGKEIFNRRVGIISSFIYIFSPFTMVYDRLAVMDSLLACCIVWALYFQIKLVKKPDIKNALIAGIVSGLGLITKSSAMFTLYLLPAGLILYPFGNKKFFKNTFRWVLFAGIVFVIGEVIYNSLRVSPWFYIIKLKNYSFIYTVKEFISSPFQFFIPNLNGLVGWFLEYATLPIIGAIILGIIFGIFSRKKEILLLFLWFIFPFLSLGAFGKVIFPRFILFMTLPLFVIAAYGLTKVIQLFKTTMIQIIVVFLFLVYPLYQSIVLMVDPVYASIPQTDRNQFFDDWPSGYGVTEVISFLESKAKSEKVVIGTEGTFGLFPAVFEIYLQNNPNVEIHGFWPVSEVPPLLIEKAKTTSTYLVFKDTQKVPDTWSLKLVSKYRRGIGNTYLLFYQVIPKQAV
ncbi:hypothetical protein A3D77_07085 [Candidatus Gottesmanbacteria bacterium RIFCSPHIGHO2_02_FULL_39_11]|uniref:Glycosyltransferase RgtA/B/C/D-like domain-containing protein n=1 Tax=Candidatus Gottesmanbacteria bacterium RIFCSPHIGHO2_02_FULL_39_11 TaxID=1798382 RepID=A0A1F5ZKA2_9BACT|nr:MAG: hypothetical protein A3D77_07085 [Candidatus Gottesmanbacteria bacterium RIFCSPHIGHO2_02_FULL_39_11]